MDKIKNPLLDALEDYRRKKPIRLHVPGHGGGRGLCPAMRWSNLPGWDVTEIEGLDDLHNPTGVIAEAQEKTAELYGAQHTFFLVNGTTVGIQALIAATCKENDTLVLPRNVHRSVLGGLVLSGAKPLFLEPDVVPEFGFAAGFDPSKLEDVLSKESSVGAVMAVHPVYYGVVSDLEVVDKVCRRYGVPLLVDEAHGTHLRFNPELPSDALSLGADAVVQSVHKTGGAFTQASWLHLGNDALDFEQVAEVLRVLQTSSPSYILLASLDAARSQLARFGKSYLKELIEMAREASWLINRLAGLTVLGKEHLGSPGAVGYDPTRLVVSVQGLGLSGYDVGRKLAHEYGIYIEMADAFNVVAVLPLGISRTDIQLLVQALTEISQQSRGYANMNRKIVPAPAGLSFPPLVITPRRAWLALQRNIPLREAVGKISGEIIAVYPPGIAIIYPGEEITSEIVEYLIQVKVAGVHCQGASDPTLSTIRVVES